MRRTLIAFVAICIAVVSLMTGLTQSHARAEGDAIIEMRIGKVGFLVGVSRGDGRLYYKGREVLLDVNGLRVGLTIGASYANMRGEVYNLNRLEDITGTYVTAQASAVAIQGGGQNLVLVNEHGVRLVLWGEQRGLDASLDAGGMLITFK
jgi:hypothetical protein